jgi:hypothetical protein
MENFKQNKLFYSALIAVGVVFVAGVGASYWKYTAKNATARELDLQRSKSRGLLNGHVLPSVNSSVSLTPANVDAATKDLADLNTQKEQLKALLAGAPESRITGKDMSNTALASEIKQSVDEWTKFAADRDIRMLPNEKCEFGFRRYIRNPGTSPKRDIVRVDQQRLIVEFLYKTLADSRPVTAGAPAPILLESIDREAVETFEKIAEGKPGAGTFAQPETVRNETDEFAPTRTFRQLGLVDTLSFRVRFVGTTATLRTFVNKVRNSGRPFAVTAVEVGTPNADMLKLLGSASPVVSSSAPSAPAAVSSLPGFFTTDAAAASNNKAAAPAPKEERKVVIRQAPAQFSVQIDYLTVVEDKPAAEGEPKK